MPVRLLTGLMLLSLLTAPMPRAEDKKVDLNQAGVTELTSLPGIGPALAGRIIEYREKNGRFQAIEELLNVRGIGEKKFAQLEDRVTVAPAPPPKSKPKPHE